METVIQFLLDGSGSMTGVKNATIEGVNSYIADRKRDQTSKNKIIFSLTVFNSNETRNIYTLTPIANVDPITSMQYRPNSNTPLYDAIGKSVTELDKYILEHPKKKRNVLFIILTDGLENASREYTEEAIAGLIGDRSKSGWEVAYMGANQDSWASASSIRIPKGNVMNYTTDNMAAAFGRVSSATAQALATPDWAASNSRRARFFVEETDTTAK